MAALTTVNGTTTLTAYIGGIEEIQKSGSTTTTTTYYAVGGKRIAAKVNGTFYYFGYDALGSQVAVFNTSGNLIGSRLYGPYGTLRYTNGSLPTSISIGFTGQQADSVTGLDYYGARYYDPVTGQFLSADTVQGNAQGMNPYNYVGGNPETLTDPSGHCPWCIMAVGALIGAVVGATINYGLQVANNYANNDANPWTDINWGNVGMGALAGGAIGLTLGAGFADPQLTEAVVNDGAADTTAGDTQSISSASSSDTQPQQPTDTTPTDTQPQQPTDTTPTDTQPQQPTEPTPTDTQPPNEATPGNNGGGVGSGGKNLVNGMQMNVDDALDSAQDFLGDGYKDMGGGRFVSADGLRQVRMGDSDILGWHGGGPHMNFEMLEPNPLKPGKLWMPPGNNLHIYLVP